MTDIIEWLLAEKAAMDECAAFDWSDDDDPDMPLHEGPVEQTTREEFQRRSERYAEAAAEIVRLRARPGWREGVEAAVGATCALHVEGVGDEIDEYNSALGDAVCAIRALKEPEPT